jgi:mRNA-degrading endonuclease YafQ of YafQ-DinJ toxin-antitoxin module
MRSAVERELIRTAAFVRAAKRHLKKNPRLGKDVANALEWLTADAFDSRLKTHKLKGDLDGVWACSAGRDLRILFEFIQNEGSEAILLLTAGTHDEVY